MSDSNRGMTVSREMPASTFNGYIMLLIMLGLVAIGGWCIAALKGGADPVLGVPLVLSILFFAMILAGFYMVQPNQAYVITQFGAYRGTDRTQGLRWVWFWQGRRKLNVRAHNVHSERVKINDLRGNPIEVACNVVWRVQDTAQASFDVDDYREFVNIQIEAGLRTVGARHPYDDMSDDDKTTLRGSADVISSELQAELNDRLKVAGIIVDEAGLTHLAYAPEIAGAMLRRQQAEAVIAARTKLVMGAVGMVEDALVKLAEDGIVDLDDERKAAMVNTGTLYQ